MATQATSSEPIAPTATLSPQAAPWRDRALVIADDIGIFLAIARSLGRAGVTVDIATCGEDYPGLRSRYVANVRVLPPYLSQPREWKAALAELAAREDYRVVFPASDSALALLAETAGPIAPDRLAIPNSAALDAFSSKAATRALAKSLGVNTAEGESLAADDEALTNWRSGPFPLLIKPNAPFASGDHAAKGAVHIVRSSGEFDTVCAALGDREIVIERYFEGEGVGLSVLARHGNIEAAWQHRRTAQTSATGRSSRRVGERVDPRLLEDAARLVRNTMLHGVAMFEFRQNSTTGDHILIEVNPRYWGSLPLALAAGADFPSCHWAMLTGTQGGASEPMAPPSLPMNKSNLQGEYDRISEIESGPASAAALARLLIAALLAPGRFDGWATDDPAPHRAELGQILQRTSAALARRLPFPGTR